MDAESSSVEEGRGVCRERRRRRGPTESRLYILKIVLGSYLGGWLLSSLPLARHGAWALAAKILIAPVFFRTQSLFFLGYFLFMVGLAAYAVVQRRAVVSCVVCIAIYWIMIMIQAGLAVS